MPKKFFLAHCPIVVYNCFINFRGKIMVKQLTKTEKVLFALLGLSVAIIVLGIWVWWLENGPETKDKDDPKTEK